MRKRTSHRDSGRTAVGTEMIRGIENALWLPSWADAVETEGGRLPRHITRETADPAPPEVKTAARRVAADLVRTNRATLVDLHRRASEADGEDADPEELGYYLTMQALGHGVGWTDDHKPFDVVLPRLETYAIRTDRGWDFNMSMSRGARTRSIGSRMRRKWYGIA